MQRPVLPSPINGVEQYLGALLDVQLALLARVEALHAHLTAPPPPPPADDPAALVVLREAPPGRKRGRG